MTDLMLGVNTSVHGFCLLTRGARPAGYGSRSVSHSVCLLQLFWLPAWTHRFNIDVDGVFVMCRWA